MRTCTHGSIHACIPHLLLQKPGVMRRRRRKRRRRRRRH